MQTPTIQGTIARITSDQLDQTLVNALQGTKLVIDTTKKSPSIPSEPFYHCTYPNQQAREAAQAECYQMAGTARAQCLRKMNEEYPNTKECGTTTGPAHSYIDFGGIAENLGAKDKPFDIQTIHRDSAGPGGINVDINYVRVTIGVGTMKASFTQGVRNFATASIWLTLNSNSPTLICKHTTSYLGCPDIELKNMKLLTRLTGIQPTADGTQLTYEDAPATFSFDRNLTNIPDSLVTTFVDVDKIIKSNVESNVRKALTSEAARAALSKALTKLAEDEAKKNHTPWSGFKKIYRAWYENGALVIDYDPA